MCLGVPGKIVQIDENPTGMTMGRVSFGGVLKEVCLAYVPEAQVGDYVIVHVGFAISQVDEAEAQEVFKFLAEMEELAELEIPQPADLVTVHSNRQQT
jgi:hydrogenase expression/formation protein HypC